MDKVSVIIINYNTFRLTADCIRSVIAHTRGIAYEIILVDNASVECDPELFMKEFPGIILVKSKINGGFAAGNNLGIEQASGNYILLLNSDTILQEDAISTTTAFLSAQSDVAITGCKMVYPDGRLQYTARRFRSIQWELLDLFRFILYFLHYPKRARLMLGKYFRHDMNMEADWLNGAFFLFRKDILTQMPANKLDDRFFMYGEDHLWCHQVKMMGHRVVFFAGATITHINSGSTDISKQLRLRTAMMKHELEIMKIRKGKGLYYVIFKLIYTAKEGTRNFIKRIIYRLTSKVVG
ncbi:MAG: glycosyltransferase family 2 protein [Bacteroidetes bacterium]|nr:glycosyltransferase family 2 protein [Bacteroidota bacterium]